MPRDYPDDVGKQSFLSEIYEKERTAQLEWYFKKTALAKDRLDDPRVESKSRQYEVFSRRIEAACPKPTPALIDLRKRRYINTQLEATAHNKDDAGSARDHSKQVDIANTTSSSTVVTLPPIASPAVPDMIEPDTPTRQKIYSQGGRSEYLRTRHRRRPESRYAFPVVSSWEYGWRLGDVVPTDEIRNPAHGRCRIIADTFYRNNGLPQHG